MLESVFQGHFQAPLLLFLPPRMAPVIKQANRNDPRTRCVVGPYWSCRIVRARRAGLITTPGVI